MPGSAPEMESYCDGWAATVRRSTPGREMEQPVQVRVTGHVSFKGNGVTSVVRAGPLRASGQREVRAEQPCGQ